MTSLNNIMYEQGEPFAGPNHLPDIVEGNRNYFTALLGYHSLGIEFQRNGCDHHRETGKTMGAVNL